MSFILDALMKSDQQRQNGREGPLPAVLAPAAPVDRPLTPAYGLLGAVLAATSVLIGMLHPWQTTSEGARTATPPAPSSTAASVLAVPPSQEIRPSAARAQPDAASPARQPKAAALQAAAPAATEPLSSGPDDKAVSIFDLPGAIQSQLPPLSVTGHVYSNAPRERIVSINDRLLQEGDFVAPKLKLEAIVPDGMILSYRGYRFRLGIP